MKKEIKICLLACTMCIATALNFIIALGCISSTLQNIGVVKAYRPIHMDLTDSICFLIVSGYGIIITILYLRRKK